jgi:hypothetical protein
MSNIEIALAVSLAAWLFLLTIGLGVAIRQVGLLTMEINRRFGQPDGATALALGAAIPDHVRRALPELARDDDSYVLWLSASCMSCKEVALQLQEGWDSGRQRPLLDRSLVLVTGSGPHASTISALIPEPVAQVADPVATRLATDLQLPGTPFVLAIREGEVAGWSVVKGFDDVVELRNRNARNAGARSRNARHDTTEQALDAVASQD